MPLVVDINEMSISLGVWKPGEASATALAYSEPGLAFVDGKNTPVFGLQAVESAKLHPTQIYTRFWSSLSADAQKTPHPKVRHHADLVWHFLVGALKELSTNETQIIFCVPADFSEVQLSLLAGIAQSLHLQPIAFLYRALATAMTKESDPNISHCTYFEMRHHEVLVTEIKVVGEEYQVTSSEQIPGQGLQRLIDHWLHIIKERYIAQHRVDPLYSGITEQQLFGQLYTYISSGWPEGRLTFQITRDESEITEEFSTSEFQAPLRELRNRIVETSQNMPVFLDPAFGRIFHTDNNPAIQTLSQHTLFDHIDYLIRPALDAISTQNEQEISVIKSCLPKQSTADVTPTQSRPYQQACATHLVCNGYLYSAETYQLLSPNGELQLSITGTDDSHVLYENGQLKIGTAATEIDVNNEAAQPGRLLRAGDQLRLNTISDMASSHPLQGKGTVLAVALSSSKESPTE